MRVYLEFAKKKFSNKMVYRFDYVLGIISTILLYVIFICIYKALYGGAQEVDGITFSMVTTNFILSLCLSNVYRFDDEFIEKKLKDGSIANEFLKPVNFKGRILAENLGENFFGICFNFLPDWVMNFMKLTPFDSIYFTPIKLYLGQITSNDLPWNLGRQVLWIGILYVIGEILWKCGEKKVVVQGG